MRPVSGPYSCLKLVPLLMGPLWYFLPFPLAGGAKTAGGGMEARSFLPLDLLRPSPCPFLPLPRPLSRGLLLPLPLPLAMSGLKD